MAKGRDKNLIELRDEALCRRYYYWTEVQRLRFDDALKVLSQQEFFISEERIMSIIRRKCRELKDLEVKPVPKVKKPRLTAVQIFALYRRINLAALSCIADSSCNVKEYTVSYTLMFPGRE